MMPARGRRAPAAGVEEAMLLQKLRRYQKRILIPLAVVVTAVMVFSMGNVSLRDIFSGTKDPVVIPGTRYRRSDLGRAVIRLRAAVPQFGSWVQQVHQRRGKVEEGDLPSAEIAAYLYYLVPLERARAAGLTVSDAQLAKDLRESIDFIVARQDEPDRAKAYAEYLREYKLPRFRFEETRRDILLIDKYRDLIGAVTGAPASIEDAYLQHCLDAQTVDLDVVTFAVKDFEPAIEPVTVEDLREEYAQRARLPRFRPYRPYPQFPKFEIQQPVRDALYTEPLARVEYLLAETEKFKRDVSVEPQEIADYYDKNRDADFRVEPEKKKENEGAEKPEAPEGKDTDSTPRFKPLDEVRDEIVRRLTEEKASGAAKKALEEAVEAYNAGAPLRETWIDGGPPRPGEGGEESALAGVPLAPAGGGKEEGEKEREEKPEEKPARALSLGEVAAKHGLSTGETELLDEESMEKLPVFEGLSYGGGILTRKVFGEKPEARAEIAGRLSKPVETKAGCVAVTLRAHHAARKQTFAEARGKLEEDLAAERASALTRKACDEVREKLVAGAGAPPERLKQEKGVKARGPFRAAALLSVGEVSEPTYDGDEKVYRLFVLTARTSPSRAEFLKDRLAVERARRAFAQDRR